jgi:hypothetical protein
MKRFSKRLDRLESQLIPKKEPKVFVYKVPMNESYPNEQELQKIKQENCADLLIVVSVDGRGSEYDSMHERHYSDF